MKIGLQYKPEEACGQDHSRPVLEHVHLDTEAGAVYASDSYIMVKVPVVVEDGDTDGPITPTVLRSARQHSRVYDNPIRCTDDGIELPGFATFVRPAKAEKLPKWEKLVPSSEPLVTVGFDLELLKRAATALGGGKCTLTFFAGKNGGTEQAVLMRKHGDMDAFALVMPIKLPDNMKAAVREEATV